VWLSRKGMPSPGLRSFTMVSCMLLSHGSQALQTSRFSAARVLMDTCRMWYIGYLTGHKQCKHQDGHGPMDTCRMWYIGYLTGHKQRKHQDFQRPGSWWIHVECGI
jgi:hypothetical protein